MPQATSQAAEAPSIDEIHEGQSYAETVGVTQEMLDAFIDVSRDRALAHVDEVHAREMGYEGRLVHGFLVSLPYSRLLGMHLPGGNTVIHQLQFDALGPVYVGDVLTYTVKVARVIPAVKTVALELTVVNQHGKLVNRGRSTCTFRRTAT